MKITSAKPEATSPSSNQDNLAATAVPTSNEAAFNQLLQLLFATTAAPAMTPSTNAATTTVDSAEIDVNTAINNSNNRSFLEVPNAANQASQQNADEINLLMMQLTELDKSKESASVVETKEANVNNAVPATDLSTVSPQKQTITGDEKSIPNQIAAMSAPQQASLAKDEVIHSDTEEKVTQKQAVDNQKPIMLNEKAVIDADVAKNIAINSNIEDKQRFNVDSKANSKLAIKLNANTGNIMAAKPATLLEGVDRRIEKPSTKLAKAVEDFSASMTASASATTPTVSNAAQLLTMPSHSEHIDRIMNAFSGMGEFINNQTAQLTAKDVSQSSTTSAGTQFDPLRDLKFDITTLDGHLSLSGDYDAQIKIYPPELGNVIAKLKVGVDSTQLVIVTENDHVKQIVESNLAMLKQHFQQADIQLSHIDVQTAQSGGKWQENNQNNQGPFSPDQQSGEFNNSKMAQKEPKTNKNAIVDTYA
jgi:flagellar hook-length control protein FliK